MESRKRKAPDEEAVTVSKTVDRRRFPHSDLSGVKDNYYRDLYTKEVDFRQLAKQDAEFAAVLKGNGQLDFTNPAAVMQLTKTLLKLDFGLRIELPDDRLCPPVLNRHNYILWLKELVDSTSYNQSGRRVTGIDIGTGASCIYPLLAVTQRPWYFIGTDIDPKSLDYARKNVEINGLQDRIRIVAKKESDAYLLPLDDAGIDRVDFVMTNPPFYTSADDMVSSAEKKARPPNSVCTGAPVEMVCSGGEVAFVDRLLKESLYFRERVQWYTAMFGKFTSLQEFVEKLRQNGIDNYAVTEFVQGSKTKRWAVGWSFGAMRPSDKAARGIKGAIWKSLLPPVVEVEISTFPLTNGVAPLEERVSRVVGSLELLSWEWDKEKLRGIGRARENVWSRAWRRKKMREKDVMAGGVVPREDGEDCKFGFLVSIQVSRTEAHVGLRWLEGHEAGLFESFSGFLKTQLKTAA